MFLQFLYCTFRKQDALIPGTGIEIDAQNVISATSDMYGSIQGLAGAAIKPVEQLEMPLIEVSDEI